ncbi:MAG: Rpn family recombination-promoting nuclease/putative transposase [Cyanosarcina radialis HA8281-LM2]|nr:Rpn family recombination-promoting nuclease/putative transposase [Cyanosarcina radialis HA8281-LM2]
MASRATRCNFLPNIPALFQFQKDESLYHRFFSESLLYLYRNQFLYDDWYGLLIFPSRSLDKKKQASWIEMR